MASEHAAAPALDVAVTMANMPDVSDAAEHVVVEPPPLGEDEFMQIIWHCGFWCHRLRCVNKCFNRLWLLPATWAGAHISLPRLALHDDPTEAVFMHEMACTKWLHSLTRVAAFNTNSLTLLLLRHSNSGLQQCFHRHSKLQLRMPGTNSGLKPANGWFCPNGGFCGVSQNVTTRGPVARRTDTKLGGMAAVCGNGPVQRDASGIRSFAIKIDAIDEGMGGGIYIGFVATPPEDIDFSDAIGLWNTAVMWRLVGGELNANVPFANGRRMQGEQRLKSPCGWTTDKLVVGDELRLTARVPGLGKPPPAHLELTADLNGEQVVLPMYMDRSSFALELWPYVAVCGRVTALRLVAS